MHRSHTCISARGYVEFASEIFEFPTQLVILENLIEARCFEFLNGFERGRAFANQVAKLDTRLDRLIGVVCYFQVVRRLEPGTRDLLALLLQIAPVGLRCFVGYPLAFAVRTRARAVDRDGSRP